ncbi:hypothetical protein [Armatimonas sp.]|uniref:hypothetical protein n=1 Tax=Armatimonas sp. TaxID=1872638 RepID=UPI003753CB4E
MRGLTDTQRDELAQEYLLAAREHFAELQRLTLDEIRHYPLTYYLAGVTVECLFRAYMTLVDAKFDDKHDLRQLAASGQFFRFMPSRQQDHLEAALSDVYRRWSNAHRYRSASSLRKFLNQHGLFKNGQQHLSGDILKPNWEILYDGVDALMTIGLERWELSKTKWNK